MDTTVQFNDMPSPVAGFLRAAVSRGRGVGSGRTIPPINAELRGFRPRLEQVRQYAELCGYANNHHLPLTYPHVLAAPLHLAVLTHKDFPLRLLGLVHFRNAVHQVRPLDRNEPIDIAVRVEGHRNGPKGVEFDLETRISRPSAEPVWYSTSTYLAPAKDKAEGGWTPPSLDGYKEINTWDLPRNLGRRYGWVAGDINPIHLHPLSARLFGFRRHIAHGMWTFARAAAELTRNRNGAGRVSMDGNFRRPIFLPGKARMLREQGGDGYAVVDPSGETFHLEGGFTAE